MNLSRGPRDLHVRDGAHRAHAAAEHRLAGDLDLALFRGVRRGHRLAHHRDRGRELRRLHRAGPDHADAADAERRPTPRSASTFPKFIGTIYEILSAPVSSFEIVLGYVGAAATKSIILGLIILATAGLFVPLQHRPSGLDGGVPGADRGDLQPVRLHHRHLGGRLREAAGRAAAGHHAADLPRRQLLFDRHAAAVLADGHAVQSRWSI